MPRPLQLLRSLLLLAAGIWLLCLLAIVAWSQREVTTSADVIVVLGAAQYAGRPSPVLRARLDHAIRLWKEGRASQMVLTGGRHPGDVLSEAAASRRYVLRRGVPDSALILEDAGRTTIASIRGAARLLAEHADAEERGPRRVLLVSDPFHMLRLDILARLNGMQPIPSPTRSSPISANRTVALEYVLRESLAIPADVLISAWYRLVPGDTVVQR
jgi:uncharacterized SAM-binding protein YcdF (DUF218 family)